MAEDEEEEFMAAMARGDEATAWSAHSDKACASNEMRVVAFSMSLSLLASPLSLTRLLLLQLLFVVAFDRARDVAERGDELLLLAPSPHLLVVTLRE